MSIEQKIAELLAESKEEILDEEEVKATKGSDEPNNKKNAVDTNPQGSKTVKEGYNEEDEDEDDDEEEEDKKEMKEAKYKKMKEEISVDVSEDVSALLNGEELSEDFKTKAATIFEAAVVNRVKQEIAHMEEVYEARLVEEVESVKEGLVEKVDGYLDYVVEQWMEQNALALESGIKSEILESFVGGLKNLFAEHYIEVPEEKFDVLEHLEQQTADLESKLNETVEKNVELNKVINTLTRDRTIEEAAEGLTDIEAEKFKGLAEELAFEDVNSFKAKLQTIRENYFPADKKLALESVVSDQSVESLTEVKTFDPAMKQYLTALSSFKK